MGDTTFIVNDKVVVQQASEKSPKQRPIGGIYCQFIDYAQEQKVLVDGEVIATYKSKDGTSSEDPTQKESVRTSKVIEELAKSINGASFSTVKQTVKASTVVDESGFVSEYKATINATPSVIVRVNNKTQNKYIPVGDLRDKTIYWPRNTEHIALNDSLEIEFFDTVVSPPAGSTAFIAFYEEGSNVLYLIRKDGKDFELSTVDDADGKNLIAVKGSIADPSLLPPDAPVGFTVRIAEKGSAPVNHYWLESVQDESFTRTIWRETMKPDTLLGFNQATMPVQLVRESYAHKGLAQFKLGHPEWGDRATGSIDSNPDPSFVGSAINSVGLFQNRLYFTAGESICMSRSSEFYEFFKTTTQTVLKTDPYDIYSDSDEVVTLKNSISFNGDLLFFSDKSQHSLSGASVVTPEDQVPLRKMTSFDTQKGVAPVAAGENVFFAFDYGQFHRYP